MRIVLTGATGFTGTALLAKLTEFAEIWCVGRKGQLLDKNIHYIEADLAQDDWLEKLPISADAIIYLAQSRQFRSFPTGALDMEEINTSAPLKLARWSVGAGVQKIIYASTGGVYAPFVEPISEEGEILSSEKMGFYPASKYAAELLLAPFKNLFKVVLLRPFFIYGGGQNADMLIPRLIKRVVDGEPISLIGDNGMRLNPVHVEDACEAITSILRVSDSETINVGGGEILSMRAIGEKIGKITKRKPVFEINEAESNVDLIGDISRMQKYVRSPLRGFEESLNEIWENH